jgi:uncharacterized protein (TIGR03083 family)
MGSATGGGPVTLQGMAAAYLPMIDVLEQTFRATERTGSTLSEAEWKLPTQCPGWTVQDVVSHLVGFELAVMGEPEPAHALPDGLDYLRNDTMRRLELPVDVRRSRPGSAVLAEFSAVIDRRLRQLRDLAASGADPEVDSLIWGPRPLSKLMPTRVFDAWVHEQDIRRATGRHGGLDSPAAKVSCQFLTRALPHMVGKAGLPAGTVVRFEVSGPLRIEHTVGEGPPQLMLRTDWETFVRLACGRVHPDLAKVAADGDPDQVRSLLAALAITP